MNSWTAVSDQTGTVYAWAMIVGGFAAPGFLFLAGVGVVLSATSKAASARERSGAVGHAASLVARRGWQVFGLAFLFRLQSFLLNPLSSPVGILKVDILNIMGPTMAAAAWLWGWPRKNAGRVAALAAAMVVFGVLTPFVRASSVLGGLPDPLESYFRPLPGRANFVFFPWSAFVFGGALVGLALASVGPSTLDPDNRRKDAKAIIALGLTGAVMAVVSYAGSYLPSVFEQSSFWTSAPSFFFLRLGILMMALPVAFFAPPFVALERFGRASLFVYWVHVELVYGFMSWPIHRTLGLRAAFAAFALFTIAMYWLVVATARIRTPPYTSFWRRVRDRETLQSASPAAR